MTARTIESLMNVLLSGLMIVIFLVLAPLWAVFYTGVLMSDYRHFARM